MTQRLLASCLAAALLLSTGCSLLSRKPAKPKESNAIATETEENLKQRYITRRSAELEAQGLTAVAARTQAVEEFRQKYEYTSAAKN